MIEARQPAPTNSDSGRAKRGNRRVARAAAAVGIVLGTMGTASPSWAGPLMGC